MFIVCNGILETTCNAVIYVCKQYLEVVILKEKRPISSLV